MNKATRRKDLILELANREIEITGRWFDGSVPAWLNRQNFPLLATIITGSGECPEGASNGHAHAHASLSNPFYGTVCINRLRDWKACFLARFPTTLILHEYAHLLQGNGHDKVWRAEYAKQLEKYGYNVLSPAGRPVKPVQAIEEAPANLWKYSNGEAMTGWRYCEPQLSLFS